MDNDEFRRSLEGEKQIGQDLVDGAEHLLRLKQQSGQERPAHQDLELPTLQKEAGDLSESLATGYETAGVPPTCEGCRKAKTSCMCKVAGASDHLKNILKGAREGLKYQAFGTGVATHDLKTKGRRAVGAGRLLGMAAPAAAVGGAGYAAGRIHEKSKEAATHKDLPSTAAKVKSHIRKNPMLRAAVIGGLATGGVNAALGAAQSPGDRVGGAVRSGISGAAIGAGGGALYHHLSTKLAEMREKTAASLLEQLKAVNPGLAVATGAGAAVGGIGTYLASRPQKDTGKSKAEEELEGMVKAQKGQPARGLLSKMHKSNTELEHGYAKAFRAHPAKAALLGALTGGVGGYGIGRLAGGIAKLRGGK